jgi:hypothetical protein
MARWTISKDRFPPLWRTGNSPPEGGMLGFSRHREAVMKKLATAVAPIALIATPAFAADGDEFIQERVKLIRSPADKADPFIKKSGAFGVLVAAAFVATSTRADNAIVTTAPLQTPTSTACKDITTFFTTSCPLSWYGVTVYGTIDTGVTWQSHGTPFNAAYGPGT